MLAQRHFCDDQLLLTTNQQRPTDAAVLAAWGIVTSAAGIPATTGLLEVAAIAARSA